MLRRTEGSTKEEQIIQKEQILLELQRVEKELQVVRRVQSQRILPLHNLLEKSKKLKTPFILRLFCR